MSDDLETRLGAAWAETVAEPTRVFEGEDQLETLRGPDTPGAEEEPAEYPLLDLASEIELGEELGKGGMGVVVRAAQRSLEREVAAKTLSGDGSQSPGKVRAFVSEGQITANLQHPNVVPIHALGRNAAGEPMLIMECVTGQSWRSLLREDPPGSRPGALAKHIGIFSAVLDACACAHEQGVLHRDLKTENVMVGSYGRVYVLDWGLAIRLDGAGQARPPHPGGTPAYMAPEMADGGRKLTPATDVYLLGAMLHELLTRRPPHTGASLVNVLVAAVRNRVLPLEPAFPAPRGVVEIAERCLATDPADRYPSARELREAWQRFVSGEERIEASEEARKRAEELLAALPALEGIGKESAAELYGRLFEVDGTLQTALQAWPENAAARALHGQVVLRIARCAVASGDLALASSFSARARALGLGEADGLEAEIEAARRFSDPETLAALDEARTMQEAVAGIGFLTAAAVCASILTVFGLGKEGAFSTTAQNTGKLLLPVCFVLALVQLPLHSLAKSLLPGATQVYKRTLALLGFTLALCSLGAAAQAALSWGNASFAFVFVLALYVFLAFALGRRLLAGRIRALFEEAGEP